MKAKDLCLEQPRQVCFKIKNFPEFVRVPSGIENFNRCEGDSDWIEYDIELEEADGWTAVCLAERAMIDDLNLHNDEWEAIQSMKDVELQIMLDGEEY
jgi:hypothetical protein